MLSREAKSSNAKKRTRTSINIDHMATNKLFVHDYFALDYLYDQKKFKECFHISRNIFLHIARDLTNSYEFFN